MGNLRGIGRIGILAAGLGVGAAVAHSPAASADASSDQSYWLSAVDASSAAALPSDTNLAISFDGMNLIEAGTASASSTTGDYGLAIAIGDNASATATNGTGEYALATGSSATAVAEGGFFNSAIADGSYALAKAGSTAAGATDSNYNTAIDIGNNPSTYLGQPDGAYAGGGSLDKGTDSGVNSHNTAIDIGNNGVDPNPANYPDGYTGAMAGDGQLIGNSGTGDGDTAINIGNDLGSSDHAAAVAGDNNYASELGNLTGQGVGPLAGLGNGNTAIADANYTSTNGVFAGDGNDNYAFADGPDNGNASAGGTYDAPGDNNIASIVDPFGTSDPASQAVAGVSDGAAGNNDVAEVLLTHGTALAGGGNLLYDIISLFGNESSATAPSGVNALLEWLATL